VRRAEGVFGADHPHTLGFTANLGLDQAAAGRQETGRETRAQALAELSAQGTSANDPAPAVRTECDIEPPES
jgi:hypothetical protein